jgi:hypothetical protein
MQYARGQEEVNHPSCFSQYSLYGRFFPSQIQRVHSSGIQEKPD